MSPSLYKTSIPFVAKLKQVTASLDKHAPNQINVLFDLVFAGVNTNGDRFVDEELENSFGTLINQPIDWDHEEPNIGTITHANFIPKRGSTPAHITCQGTIWSWRYPEYADMILNSASLGEMGFGEAASHGMSLEAHFHDADYVIGDFEQVIPMKEDTDGSLEMLKGKTLGGKPVSRLLKGIIFGGAGVTPNPAEKQAMFKAAASNKSLHNGRELFSDLGDTHFALASLRMFPIDKREHVEASLEYFASVSSTLGEDEVTEAQVREAEERLSRAARDFGLSQVGQPSAENTGDDENAKEESEAIMNKDEKLVESEEDAAVESTDAEEVIEDEVESVEDEAEAEETEASEDTASEVTLEGLSSTVSEMMGLLKQLLPSETEASEESEDEDEVEDEDELTVASKRVGELEQKLEASEARFRGHVRFGELTKAGVSVEKKAADKKKEFLASLTEDAWKTYIDDVKNASKASASSEEVAEVEETEDAEELDETSASVINLETDADEDPVKKYRTFWSNSKLWS